MNPLINLILDRLTLGETCCWFVVNQTSVPKKDSYQSTWSLCLDNKSLLDNWYKVVPPSYVYWFINPINYGYINYKPQWNWSYFNQLSYRKQGHCLVAMLHTFLGPQDGWLGGYGQKGVISMSAPRTDLCWLIKPMYTIAISYKLNITIFPKMLPFQLIFRPREIL